MNDHQSDLVFQKDQLYVFLKDNMQLNPDIPEPITAIFINKLFYAAVSLYSSIDGHEHTKFLSP